tara:strand:+ start:2042 stop:3247 length:1206 start_codon:yes stop_codon:yes gene_type:complete
MKLQVTLVLITFLFISLSEAGDHTNGVAPFKGKGVERLEIGQDKAKCNGDLVPVVEIESLRNTSQGITDNILKDNVPPIFLFRRDSHFHVGLKLKNDFFSAPLNLIRQGELMVFDQGETHGTDMFIGVKDSMDTRMTYLYETNLYTQKSSVPEPVDDPKTLFQDYTTEQIYQIIFDNLESSDSLTYDIAFGVLEYIRDNDTDIFLASTQQRLLHNGIDEAVFGSDIYEVENNHRKKTNEYGAFTRLNIGYNQHLLDTDKLKGQSNRYYLEAEISNLHKRNYLAFGVSRDFYYRFKNDEKKFLIFNIPKDFVGGHLGVDIPAKINQYHYDDHSELGFQLNPEIKAGLSFGRLELGYSSDMIFGNLTNHVEENRSNTIIHNGRALTDPGDMGTGYIRFNGKFK